MIILLRYENKIPINRNNYLLLPFVHIGNIVWFLLYNLLHELSLTRGFLQRKVFILSITMFPKTRLNLYGNIGSIPSHSPLLRIHATKLTSADTYYEQMRTVNTSLCRGCWYSYFESHRVTQASLSWQIVDNMLHYTYVNT